MDSRADQIIRQRGPLGFCTKCGEVMDSAGCALHGPPSDTTPSETASGHRSRSRVSPRSGRGFILAAALVAVALSAAAAVAIHSGSVARERVTQLESSQARATGQVTKLRQSLSDAAAQISDA